MISAKPVYTEDGQATTDPHYTKYSTPHSEGAASIDEGWRFTGFTQAENSVLRDSEHLSLEARFTYTILRTYGWQDEVCWPGMARLCKDVGRSEKKVRQYIRELIDAGLIIKRRRGLNLTNTYRFTQPVNPDTGGLPATVWLQNPHVAPEQYTGNDQEQYTGNGQEQYPCNADEDAVDTDPVEEDSDPSGGEAHTGRSSINPSKPAATQPNDSNDAAVVELDPTRGLVNRMVTKLVGGIRDAGGTTLDSDHGKYGGQFKRLISEDGVTEEQLERVVDRIVARWSDIDLTAKQALRDVLNGRDSNENAGRSSSKGTSGSTTPEPALEALRERKSLARFAAIAERWDFRSELVPPYPILKELGNAPHEQLDALESLRKTARRESGELHDAGENAATPYPAIEALRADKKYSRYVGLANEHDFTSSTTAEGVGPRILMNIGGNEQEQKDNFRKMGNVARNAMKRHERGEDGGESKESGGSYFKEGFEDWFK